MKTSSAKAKGRLLQQWTASELLKRFTTLTENDLRSASSSVNGEDVQRSQAARKLIPYQFECKNRQAYKGVYDAFAQAGAHGTDTPVVIIKMNRKSPLAIVDAEVLFNLIGAVHGCRRK